MTSRWLTKALQETLTLFAESGVPWTTSEVAEQLDLGRRSAYERLDRLAEHDRLKTKKVGANGRVWWRPVGQSHSTREGTVAEESLIHDVLDTAEIGVFVLDENFDVVWINSTTERYFGLNREDVIGRDKRQLVTERIGPHIEGEKAFTESVLATYEDNTSTEMFECHVSAGEDGETRWIEHRSMPIESGQYAGGRIELCYDISERKERERELERARGRLRVLFDEAPDAIVIHDEDGEILDTNEQNVENLGYARDELTSMNVTDYEVGVDAEKARQYWAEMAVGETVKVDGEHERSDGSQFPVEVWVSKIEVHGEPRYLALSRDITERKKRERRLERQREQLAAVNNLNAMMHDVTDAVIKQSTRKEIEQTVCETLVDVDSYESAWIDAGDTKSKTVNVRAEAGVARDSDGSTTPVDSGGKRYRESTGNAIRTGRMQVVSDADVDPGYDPWCDSDEAPDTCSVAAIPLVHDDTVYGVLNVCTDHPSAFEVEERTILSQFGDIVSQAIAAAERKQALMSDEVVELEFQVPDIFDVAGIDATADGRITLTDMVATSDSANLVYGTATPDARETLDALAEQHSDWESVTTISEGDDSIRFQARISEAAIHSNVASQGGTVEEIVIEGGNLSLCVHFSPRVGVSTVTEAVHDTYPTAQLVAKRQFPRPQDSVAQVWQSLAEELTDRQQAALEVASRRGYFEWPRETSGETLANSLGIAPSTFSQHLRKAEKTVVDAVFSSATAG